SEFAGDRRAIDVGEQTCPERIDQLLRFVRSSKAYGFALEVRLQGLGALEHCRELLEVLRALPGEPIESFRAPGCRARDRGAAANAIGQESRTREGVRPSAGPTRREEPVGAQVVGDRHDV